MDCPRRRGQGRTARKSGGLAIANPPLITLCQTARALAPRQGEGLGAERGILRALRPKSSIPDSALASTSAIRRPRSRQRVTAGRAFVRTVGSTEPEKRWAAPTPAVG